MGIYLGKIKNKKKDSNPNENENKEEENEKKKSRKIDGLEKMFENHAFLNLAQNQSIINEINILAENQKLIEQNLRTIQKENETIKQESKNLNKNSLIKEIEIFKENQELIEKNLRTIQKENETLKQDNANLKKDIQNIQKKLETLLNENKENLGVNKNNLNQNNEGLKKNIEEVEKTKKYDNDNIVEVKKENLVDSNLENSKFQSGLRIKYYEDKTNNYLSKDSYDLLKINQTGIGQNYENPFLSQTSSKLTKPDSLFESTINENKINLKKKIEKNSSNILVYQPDLFEGKNSNIFSEKFNNTNNEIRESSIFYKRMEGEKKEIINNEENNMDNLKEIVYISITGNTYHKSMCLLMENKVEEVLLENAIKLKFKPCKFCFNEIEKPKQKIYRTSTGKCYHLENCYYLFSSQIEITLDTAKTSFLNPCSICKPPVFNFEVNIQEDLISNQSQNNVLEKIIEEKLEEKLQKIKNNGQQIVYKTYTGSKYHRDYCGYLRSKIETTLESALSFGLTPCSRCDPPILEEITDVEVGISKKDEENNDIIVYTTATGKKYHTENCRWGYIEIKLSEAVKSLGPCLVCRPPLLKNN